MERSHQKRTDKMRMVNREMVNAYMDQNVEGIPEFTSGSIKIDDFPTRAKGRSLIATKSIEPGDLILVQKAIALCKLQYADGDHNGDRRSEYDLYNIGLVQLVDKIQQKLKSPKEEPRVCEEFYELYAAKDTPQPTPSDDEAADKKRIKDILTYNHGFCVTYEVFSRVNPEAKAKNPEPCIGLWLPEFSYINHSCCDANCFHKVIGDKMFIRAVKHIDAGEEIITSYTNPCSNLTIREQLFQNKFFPVDDMCGCELCNSDASPPPEVLEIVNIFKTLRKTIKDNDMTVQQRNDLIALNISKLKGIREGDTSTKKLLSYYIAREEVLEIADTIFYRREHKLYFGLLEQVYYALKEVSFKAIEAAHFGSKILGHQFILQTPDEAMKFWCNRVKEDMKIAFGHIDMIKLCDYSAYYRLFKLCEHYFPKKIDVVSNDFSWYSISELSEF